MNLLKSLGFDAPSWQDLSFLLLALIVLASSAGAAWAWWERRRQDPWLRAYHSMRQALARNGVESAPQVAPRTMADRSVARWGDAGRSVAEVLQQMEALRYAARPGAPPSGTAGPRGPGVGPTTLTRLSLRALARRLERALAELPDA